MERGNDRSGEGRVWQAAAELLVEARLRVILFSPTLFSLPAHLLVSPCRAQPPHIPATPNREHAFPPSIPAAPNLRYPAVPKRCAPARKQVSVECPTPKYPCRDVPPVPKPQKSLECPTRSILADVSLKLEQVFCCSLSLSFSLFLSVFLCVSLFLFLSLSLSFFLSVSLTCSCLAAGTYKGMVPLRSWIKRQRTNMIWMVKRVGVLLCGLSPVLAS